jgi:hypothetical protein
MGRKRGYNKSKNKIDENLQAIAESAEQANKKIDELVKGSKSNLAKIATIITLIAAIFTIGGVTVKGIIQRVFKERQQYQIYLSSEYYKLKVGAENTLTAALNFDADSVRVVSYVNSVQSGDTINLKQKNPKEWQNRVTFQEAGRHEVVVTATTPDGDVVEDKIHIEVSPADIDIFNQIF